MSEPVLKTGIEWLAEFSRERRQARAKKGPTLYYKADETYEYDPDVAGFKKPKVWIMACRPGWTRSNHPKKWADTALRIPRHSDVFVTALMTLQKGRCYICSRALGAKKLNEDMVLEAHAKSATRDHVLPRALGGGDHQNILIAHQKCNAEKGHRMPTACELLLRDFIHIDLGGDDLLNTLTAEELRRQQLNETGVKQMLDVSL